MRQQTESSSAFYKITERNELLSFIQKKLKTKIAQIDALFWAQHPIELVINERSMLIDQILKEVWQWFEIDHYPEVGLYAVGGYGHARLHPFSDIDTLILIQETGNLHLEQRIENFISFIWDCGITLSCSVRTFKECKLLSYSDHTIFTHLLSFRYLIGNLDYKIQLEGLVSPLNKNWPFAQFFDAKQKERALRYQRYQNTEYNQEPNLKESPGGLRDIDFIYWIAQSKYGNLGIHQLIQEGTLSHYEYSFIKKSRHYLWYVRYILHLIANKATDRLYLEYQSELVKKLNIHGKTLNHAISEWMQYYFRTVSQVREITDILSQHFYEEIHPAILANKRFLSLHCKQTNHLLEIDNESDYLKNPELFIKLFLYYAQIIEINGLSAKTRHFIYDYFNSQHLPNFQKNKKIQSTFLQIFNYPKKSADTLSLMHQLGVLSKIVTCFHNLTGQMQYDLNHIYTVDAHTLRVLQYIQDFYQENQSHHLPFLHLSKNCANDPIILYVAALFHDIGKGKDSNHSEIGKNLALDFCYLFKLTEKQTDYIAWLVLNHLQLSHFAQRKDINDPNVISEFSKIADNKEKLCYLYLLTIADIQGTNPKLWNEWRKALLSELFNKTYQYYTNQPKTDINRSIDYKKELAAAELIKHTNYSRETIDSIWNQIHQDYFQNTDFISLIWQTKCILSHGKTDTTLVEIRPHWNKVGTDIFIYAKNYFGLFAYLCQTLEKLLLTIVEAKIAITTDDFCVYSMTVLESSGKAISDPTRLFKIRSSLSALCDAIKHSSTQEILLPNYARYIPRWYRYYQTQAKVEIYTLPGSNYSTIEIHAPDFPGLLARVSQVMVTHSILIHSAKINTLGDKVIDFFYVSKKTDPQLLIDNDTNLKIKEAILQALKAPDVSYWKPSK